MQSALIDVLSAPRSFASARFGAGETGMATVASTAEGAGTLLAERAAPLPASQKQCRAGSAETRSVLIIEPSSSCNW
jgi:hypothetical protein